MKKSNYLLSFGITISVFAFIVIIASCQKSKDSFDELLDTKNISLNQKMSSTTFNACLETYDIWQWSVSYACPQNSVELALNKKDIKRAKRIDSITKANPSKYPVTAPVLNDPKKEAPQSFSILQYGVPTTSIIDEVGSAPEFGGSVITLYILEYGPYGGVISLGIKNGGYSRAVAFYPNTYSIVKDVSYPGVFTNTSGLAYTYSISKTATFLGPFLNYLSKRQTPTVSHNYTINSFEGYHLFKEAIGLIGISLPTVTTIGDYPHSLAQAIRTWTPPANVTVNLDGGFIPLRQGDGGDL
ncbi:hypothetical protein G7074_14670 [Pedobacter sp. HDW13]|uniref:hypothetical protein n=1 Tax=unclassified Pedobacter TaxID=2628915 RepID=UPI001319C532|nr:MULTISPECIES: hypothetical protein [unclassified Pedobacter]QIL40397.1 hypothetical protein G7074_14670 [Pedobacter sp. HDW13]